ncbi:MAG: methyltransferase domain-containing protein [Verrucomicrobia bacterium]|nr:methyltransferase domain-containing protein [Verrucomicrobiota bacterium]
MAILGHTTGSDAASVSTEERVAFDEAGYLCANPDVAAAVADGRFRDGFHHFCAYGRSELRSCRGVALSPRQARIFAGLRRDGLGLEIGPSYNPVAPKARGFRVHVLDHLPTEALRRKYAHHQRFGVDPGRIEEVDFVWSGQPFAELTGRRAGYDWIIASHVLEHVPDPVRFLQECASVLKPDGRIALVLPDTRGCFDHFGELTRTGEILDAFAERRTRPTPGQVFNYAADSVTKGGRIAWPPGQPGPYLLVCSLEAAVAQWRRSATTSDYHDVHCWRFTPESFHLILADLAALGLVTLGPVQHCPTDGTEFQVTLAPGRPAAVSARLELLQRIRTEFRPTAA